VVLQKQEEKERPLNYMGLLLHGIGMLFANLRLECIATK
jgi:hypothetical protein